MNARGVLVAVAVMAQVTACATTAAAPAPLPARCLVEASTAAPTPVSTQPPFEGARVFSAKRWVHARYFNQLKKKVAEHWKPADEYPKHDPDGALYGGKLLYTELEVSLRPDGSLDRAILHRPSGVDFLDDAALEAFEKAEPFGETPCTLLKNTGQVRFRFGFFFDTRNLSAKSGEPVPSP